MQFLTVKSLLALIIVGGVSTYLGATRINELRIDEFHNAIASDFVEPNQEASPGLSETAAPAPPQFGEPNQRGQWESFDSMHAFYTHAFVESQGFGAARILSFDEPSVRHLRIDDLAYRIEKMNLLGLGEEVPRVYESSWVGVARNQLMRSQLENYSTRKLNEFEETSLDKMFAGESLIWSLNHDKSQATLIGALQAGQSCVKCHAVAEGTLLGAFVYQMVKSEPIRILPGEIDIEAQLKLKMNTISEFEEN